MFIDTVQSYGWLMLSVVSQEGVGGGTLAARSARYLHNGSLHNKR